MRPTAARSGTPPICRCSSPLHWFLGKNGREILRRRPLPLLLLSLLALGVKAIRAYDPLATEEAQHYFDPARNHLFEKISYHDSAHAAMEGSDALFISTDWEEFRGISNEIERSCQPPYLIIDGLRMISDFAELVARGYTYLAVGSPVLLPHAPPAEPTDDDEE